MALKAVPGIIFILAVVASGIVIGDSCFRKEYEKLWDLEKKVDDNNVTAEDALAELDNIVEEAKNCTMTEEQSMRFDNSVEEIRNLISTLLLVPDTTTCQCKNISSSSVNVTNMLTLLVASFMNYIYGCFNKI